MSPSARTGRLPAARRRQQLLGVALELFSQQGYHDTSMEQIADEAGVTKPVLYQHFSSKSDLYLELLQIVGRDLLEEIAAGATAATSPHLRVLAGFRAYFSFVGRRTSAFRLLFGSDVRQSDDFAAAAHSVEDSIAATISTFILAEVDDEHRLLLGYAIVGLAEVAGRQWVQRSAHAGGTLGPLDPTAGEVLATRLADLVWAGLRGLRGEGHEDGTP
ncbi:MAG: TetR/AcrR family transcriptional regulator [Actinomycetota bacterium]|nr:TetR/AcrR family transcriptional regulator [Actinomycetota bacterium]